MVQLFCIYSDHDVRGSVLVLNANTMTKVIQYDTDVLIHFYDADTAEEDLVKELHDKLNDAGIDPDRQIEHFDN